MKSKKTGFFFLNNPHHIYHAASIAFELAKLPNQEVKIFGSTQVNIDILNFLAKEYFGDDWLVNPPCVIELLLPSIFYRATRYYKRKAFPGYSAIFKKHWGKFLDCDVLVSPSDEILKLKKHPQFSKKKFVYTHHGAGDRAYGFSAWVDEFDLAFLSSEELKRRFHSEGIGLAKNGMQLLVTGYPKFDLCLNKGAEVAPVLFKNTKPCVLYNPHFTEDLSSWFKWGESVIDFFLQHKEYNLIVAPHINLPQREKNKLALLCKNAENILVDVDESSRYLFDMTYTKYADIYLGDVSSQLYEFLYDPRPCLFLNTFQVDWRGSENYQSWHLGEVIDNEADIGKAIIKSQAKVGGAMGKQAEAFSARFSNIHKMPSFGAAKAIESLD